MVISHEINISRDELLSESLPVQINGSVVFSESRIVTAPPPTEHPVFRKRQIRLVTVRPSPSMPESFFTPPDVDHLVAESISNPPHVDDYYSRKRSSIKEISFLSQQIKNRCIPSHNSSCPDITLVTQLTYLPLFSLI